MEDLERLARGLNARSELVGQAPAFRRAVELLESVAASDAAVLISGETGTGKELAARAVHYLGGRAGFPFVPINCGSLPEALLEAELFGHERGAFTDAVARRPGLIAQADGGTLFLDEVDTLPHRAQVALLRVLQDRRLRPIGASRELAVDVRFVAATNARLEERVRDRTFRSDLYYRLCVFTVDLPPLRDRREDVAPLARHFLAKHATRADPDPRLTPAAYQRLAAHDWPGNVRELENAILRACHLCRGRPIDAADLCLPGAERAVPVPVPLPAPASVSASAGQPVPSHPLVGWSATVPVPPLREEKRRAIEAFERDYLVRLMQVHDGNVSRAARAVGKDRRELGKLLKKYDTKLQQAQALGAQPLVN